MKTLEVNIIQVSAKNLLFRKCSKCRGKVTFVSVNNLDPGQDQFYCENCKKIILNFNTNYKLNFTVMNIYTRKLEQLVAYDKVVEELIGCSATEFDNVYWIVGSPFLYM